MWPEKVGFSRSQWKSPQYWLPAATSGAREEAMPLLPGMGPRRTDHCPSGSSVAPASLGPQGRQPTGMMRASLASRVTLAPSPGPLALGLAWPLRSQRPQTSRTCLAGQPGQDIQPLSLEGWPWKGQRPRAPARAGEDSLLRAPDLHAPAQAEPGKTRRGVGGRVLPGLVRFCSLGRQGPRRKWGTPAGAREQDRALTVQLLGATRHCAPEGMTSPSESEKERGPGTDGGWCGLKLSESPVLAAADAASSLAPRTRPPGVSPSVTSWSSARGSGNRVTVPPAGVVGSPRVLGGLSSPAGRSGAPGSEARSSR